MMYIIRVVSLVTSRFIYLNFLYDLRLLELLILLGDGCICNDFF